MAIETKNELSDALAQVLSERVASGEMRVVALSASGGVRDIRDWLESTFGLTDYRRVAVAVMLLKDGDDGD